MIADLGLGGVLVPGLLGIAFAAAGATLAVSRLLAAARLHRLFAHPALVELAAFVIVFGLLVELCGSAGSHP